MTTKYCIQCGTDLPEGSAFCDRCGAPQTKSVKNKGTGGIKRFWYIPVLLLLLAAGIAVTLLFLVDKKPEDPMAWLLEYDDVAQLQKDLGGDLNYSPVIREARFDAPCLVNGEEGGVDVSFDEDYQVSGFEFEAKFEDLDDGNDYFYKLAEIYTELYGEPIRETMGVVRYGSDCYDFLYFTNEDDELLVTLRRSFGYSDGLIVRIDWRVPFED